MVSYAKRVDDVVIFHVCSIAYVINFRCDSYFLLYFSISICQTIIDHQLLR